MYLSTERLTYPKSQPQIPPYWIQSLLEKGSGELNEDVLLNRESLFGVFDGATSLDKRRFQNNITGGLIAARTAAHTFTEEDAPLNQLAEKANQLIRQAQLSENLSMNERQNLWSTSMAVVRLNGKQLEYCQTGDTVVLLIYKDDSYKVVTPDTDIDKETLQLWKTAQVSSDTRIHEHLSRQIQKVRLEMNVRYGVLNGEPEALKFLRHGYIDLTDVSDTLLFTDGLFLPKEHPQDDHDWQSFVDLYSLGGLQAVRDHVRRLQQMDQSLQKYPRFKPHDDIAAVAISC